VTAAAAAAAASAVVVASTVAVLVTAAPRLVAVPAQAQVALRVGVAGRALMSLRERFRRGRPAVRVLPVGVLARAGRVLVRAVRVLVRVTGRRMRELLGPVAVALLTMAVHLARGVVVAAAEDEGWDEHREHRAPEHRHSLRSETRGRQPDSVEFGARKQGEQRGGRHLEDDGDPVLEADRLHVSARQERQPGRAGHEPDGERAQRQRQSAGDHQTARPAVEEEPAEPGLKRRDHQEPRRHDGQVGVVAGGRDVQQPGADQQHARERRRDARATIKPRPVASSHGLAR
jgi:hypothetical protein